MLIHLYGIREKWLKGSNNFVYVHSMRISICRFMSEIELVLYCDFHGHSRKQNVFIYGCENKHLPKERLKERIFPVIFSKNDPSKVCLSLLLTFHFYILVIFSSRTFHVNLKYRNRKKELDEW